MRIALNATYDRLKSLSSGRRAASVFLNRQAAYTAGHGKQILPLPSVVRFVSDRSPADSSLRWCLFSVQRSASATAADGANSGAHHERNGVSGIRAHQAD